jgi:hypothetical protein
LGLCECECKYPFDNEPEAEEREKGKRGKGMYNIVKKREEVLGPTAKLGELIDELYFFSGPSVKMGSGERRGLEVGVWRLVWPKRDMVDDPVDSVNSRSVIGIDAPDVV